MTSGLRGPIFCIRLWNGKVHDQLIGKILKNCRGKFVKIGSRYRGLSMTHITDFCLR